MLSFSISTTAYETNLSTTIVRASHLLSLSNADGVLSGLVHRSINEVQEHPQALQPLLPELRAFAEHNHYNVLHPILRRVT